MKSVLRRHPVAAVAAALVVAVAAGVALAPWWIDLPAVRARLEAAASKAVGGSVTSARIGLSWRPTPEAVLESVRVVSPAVTARVASVRVGFAFGPLVRGRFEPSSVSLEGADVFLGRKDGRGIWVEGLVARASLDFLGGAMRVAVSRLSAASPALTLEGVFRSSSSLSPPAPSSASITARGSLDVAGVRSALLEFAGDDRTVAEIFSIVRGGRLSTFSFEASGPSPGAMFDLANMKIRADVEGARVVIEGPGLDLREVSADVALEGSVLTVERASARLGKSKADGGTLLVGLAPGDGRLRVEAQVRADLAGVPAILARAIPDRSFREELALVEDLEGRAAGRLTIGDCTGDLNAAVSVSELQFSANYRRIPWPLRVDGGEFTFDGTRAGVNRLSGRVGRSTFSGMKANVRLGKTPALEAGSGSIDVSLEDFLEGVRKGPGAEPLARDIIRLEGSLRVDLQRLVGPLARLGEASVDASGTFREILVSSSSLPALSIPSGRFSVDDETIRVEGADARSLDASLLISGVWNGWRGGDRSLDATVNGTLGPEAIRWGWERGSLPAELLPAAPITLGAVRVALAPGGALSASGDLVVAGGPRLTLDLAGDGKKIDVRNLTVADGDATASMALLRPDAAFDVRFKGRLALSTVERLFAEGRRRPGGIEGDFRALVPWEGLDRSTAEGALTATGFEVPTPAGPVTIERADLRAAKNRLEVASSSFVLDGLRFSAAGRATLGDGAVALDMDVGTGDLAWPWVEKVLDRVAQKKKEGGEAAAAGTKAEAAPKADARAPLAIRGDLRISLDAFSYEGLVWKPVLADLKLGADSSEARLREAGICGVSTTGAARFRPGGVVSVEARVKAAGPDVNVPLACLGVKNVGMTGAYEASATLEGEGPASDLPRAVRGPLAFRAVKGRIGKATLLTRILGVINATDVFAGKSGGRVGEAMPYEEIALNGDLGDGRVSIREAALKSPSITMAASGTVGLMDKSLDLVVLSHPLSTVDKVVQAVPVVRHVLGHDFLAVAVKVTGSLGDPKVTITPGRDVGKGLVGILERTVTLPVKVLDPPPQPAR